MIIELHAHHTILFVGVIGFFSMFIGYSGSDRYGVEALFRFMAGSVVLLFSFCLWLFSKYMGWF